LKTKAQILVALQEVKDPEIPVISVVDLGIITKIEVGEGLASGEAKVTMTPTFVGCPAIKHMQNEVQKAVEALGFDTVEVVVDYTIPWNSNMVSKRGLQQLKDFRLSPPKRHCGTISMADLEHAQCPNCFGTNTTLLSPFGPTLCRAMFKCNTCGEGFEQFKAV
jgi:ring-1,2-phenylacetyl-CoA epoxidase subunit PaaD